jgi:hypothetical protein
MISRERAIFGALLLFTLAVYCRLWNALPLSWDDGSNIFAISDSLSEVWSKPSNGLYVPVIRSVWAILLRLGGGDSWPFHVLNVLLHLLNITIVYLLLRALAARWNLKSPAFALAGAALFALHPLQAESVAWISGGRDLLAAFFALAAAGVYYSRPGRRGFLLASVLISLGLLSKPGVVTVPAAILFIDIVLLEREWKGVAWRMASWSVLSLSAIGLALWAQSEHFADPVQWWQRPLVMGDAFHFYAHKILLPYPLSGNYARTPEKVLAQPRLLAGAVAFWLVIAFFALWSWRRSKHWLILIPWFLLLLPVSGLVPFASQGVSGVSDHFNYLPMFAVAALFMLLLDAAGTARVMAYAGLALTCVWAAATWQRLEVWKSDKDFFTDMARTAPDSYSTAIGMSIVMCDDVKDFDQGLKWTGKALEARPDDIVALANRAFCLVHAGRPRAAAEMEYYLDKIDYEQMAATQPTALSSLLSSIGAAYFDEKFYEQGFYYLCEAYRVKPSEPSNARNLQAAAEIMKQNGLTPTCQKPPEEEAPFSIEDLLPQEKDED